MLTIELRLYKKRDFLRDISMQQWNAFTLCKCVYRVNRFDAHVEITCVLCRVFWSGRITYICYLNICVEIQVQRYTRVTAIIWIKSTAALHLRTSVTACHDNRSIFSILMDNQVSCIH